jgi:16S rRNA processing protein RimM
MRVGRPHGLDGSFHVDAPLAEGDTVTIAGREFTVAERKGTDARPIVRLEGVDDRDAAEALRGETLTPSNEQRATSNEAEWPIDDLIGCRIEGIGEVTAVLGGVSCDVLEAGGHLIPLVTDAVTRVDVENGVIEVNREFLGL